MQTVWLGRHPAEKISAGPKGQLIQFRITLFKKALTEKFLEKNVNEKTFGVLKIWSGVQEQKLAWLNSEQQGIQRRKSGLANPYVLFNRG